MSKGAGAERSRLAEDIFNDSGELDALDRLNLATACYRTCRNAAGAAARAKYYHADRAGGTARYR